jgi:hypothetical protein
MCGALILERGEVIERLEMPPGVGVSGLESDGGDHFYCGGGRSGKVRTVRRPRRASATGSDGISLSQDDGSPPQRTEP